MVDKIDKRAVNALLYGVSKAVRSMIGRGADPVQRLIGPLIIEEFEVLGVEFKGKTHEELSGELKKVVLDLGMCDEIDIKENDTNLTVSVKGCSFWEATMALRDKGIEPFTCPFANLTMALLDKNAGHKTKIEKIEPDGDHASLITLQKV